MNHKRLSNVIGFDDAPFEAAQRGPVAVVGAVFAGPRLDGVLMGEVEKDGFDSAARLATLVAESKFAQQTNLIMLQGITLGGFNVVDVFSLHQTLKLPVLVVTRREPEMDVIQAALLENFIDGAERWAVLERLGPMEAAGDIFVQRVGLSLDQARQVIESTAIHSRIPEPVRAAHLIAGALGRGQSRGNP
ncbi:DUF99 family protein [Chloroflexota bacterium]